ncbi:hypothetical protein O3W44_21660 [Pantoea sp. LMR881]|uniref:hypothetical protein n=1 Tax=Pantoea sp. LMR881 TaxID=3014336 RepID=UPI0022AF86F8|nr:hypothetical protein [Pantoea sp. LMR881]MCZ4060970.1 hypothetical protein [Pantoea sp. LMR881]MCZ4061142.1 hypothetical protein [Pantoea sp. LMR881]
MNKETKWVLEEVIDILRVLGHTGLWYHEERFGHLPVTRIIVSDDNRTLAMWSDEKKAWEIWPAALTVVFRQKSAIAATGQAVTGEWMFQRMTIEPS